MYNWQLSKFSFFLNSSSRKDTMNQFEVLCLIRRVVKWNVALIVVGAAIFCVLPVGFCTLITHEHCIKPVKMWVRRRSQRASKKAPKEHPQRPSHATMEGNSSEGCEYQAEKPCSVVAPSCPPCPPPAYESTVNLNDKV